MDGAGLFGGDDSSNLAASVSAKRVKLTPAMSLWHAAAAMDPTAVAAMTTTQLMQSANANAPAPSASVGTHPHAKVSDIAAQASIGADSEAHHADDQDEVSDGEILAACFRVEALTHRGRVISKVVRALLKAREVAAEPRTIQLVYHKRLSELKQNIDSISACLHILAARSPSSDHIEVSRAATTLFDTLAGSASVMRPVMGNPSRLVGAFYAGWQREKEARDLLRSRDNPFKVEDWVLSALDACR
jgi:hypothetical protein